jgi:predicted dithiol-disulfide oxidoreductase (DUF899 family)
MNFKSYDEQINVQEKKVHSEIKKLNQLHQSRPPELVKNYEFKNLLRASKLIELFNDKEELIVIHNMGKNCSNCTLWADGFNGYYHQLQTRSAFALISNDSPEQQHQFATSRKWTFPIYSSLNTTFFEDMGFSEIKNEKINFLPGVSIFHKFKDGSIKRTTRAHFGPGDLFSSIWHLLELLPNGIANWEPDNNSMVTPNGMLQIDGLNVVAIYAKNIEESINFYKEVLGFKHLRDMKMGGTLLYNKNIELTLYIGNDHSSQISLCFNSHLGVLKAAEILKLNNIEISN